MARAQEVAVYSQCRTRRRPFLMPARASRKIFCVSLRRSWRVDCRSRFSACEYTADTSAGQKRGLFAVTFPARPRRPYLAATRHALDQHGIPGHSQSCDEQGTRRGAPLDRRASESRRGHGPIQLWVGVFCSAASCMKSSPHRATRSSRTCPPRHSFSRRLLGGENNDFLRLRVQDIAKTTEGFRWGGVAFDSRYQS